MKKIGYSSGLKAVVTLLQEMFSVILVIGIILVSTLFDRSMLDVGDIRNTKFEESEYYVGLFENAVEEVLDYTEYKKQFETEGAYNPEKAVNVMAYWNVSPESMNVKTSLNNSDKFRYYLEDLENWSKDYTEQYYLVEHLLFLMETGQVGQLQKLYIDGELVQETVKTIETIQDMDAAYQEQIINNAESYYGSGYDVEEYNLYGASNAMESVFSDVATQEALQSDIGMTESGEGLQEGERAVSEELYQAIRLVEEGRLFELEGESLLLILEDMGLLDTTVSQEGSLIEEKYMTIDGTTIMESFQNGTITAQEMQQVNVCLRYALENIGDEITTYKRLVNKYEKGNSNLQFFIYSEKDNQYYTNIKENMSWDGLSAYGKRLGSYFYYSKNDIRLDTNVAGMEDTFYERYEGRNNGQNSIVFVGVDTTFVQNDILYQARQEYNQLQPWSMISLVSVVVSIFGSFLCFIYLSLAAGRSPYDEEIHLNWFDHIKTEIMILAFGIVFVGSALVFHNLTELIESSDLIGIMIMAGGLTFTIVAVFMIFYMSFIRRIKAGTMWSESVMCWIGKGVQKVINNWRPSIKIIIAFSLHIIVTVFMALIAIVLRHRTVTILLLILYLFICAAEMLIFLREGVQRNTLISGIKRIAGGELEYKIDTSKLKGDNNTMGEAVNTIGEGLYRAVDDSTKNERLKADLITNVSHDIKTPLTSIINYVDLLKREELENERAKNYIRVLDAKSQRLKQLTEDLVEASKISSGNITLQMDRLNFVELVYQTAGEFNEKFEEKGLTAITKLPKEPVIILADGRRIWRVIENLYNNVAKYAMENTRVYVDMEVQETSVTFSIKNISRQALNIDASELTERFIRGDVSRSTEGSGLGLSIAMNLTQLMGGAFHIYLDGDLFKVTVTFPVVS